MELTDFFLLIEVLQAESLQIVDILSTSWELNSSYLQVVDTGNLLLGEGEGADIDEVNLQIVDPRSLLLGVGNLQIGFLGSQSLQILELGQLQSSDCCSRPVRAWTLDQRHLEAIVKVDKSVGFKPFGRSLQQEMIAEIFKNVSYILHKSSNNNI